PCLPLFAEQPPAQPQPQQGSALPPTMAHQAPVVAPLQPPQQPLPQPSQQPSAHAPQQPPQQPQAAFGGNIQQPDMASMYSMLQNLQSLLAQPGVVNPAPPAFMPPNVAPVDNRPLEERYQVFNIFSVILIAHSN